MNTLSKTATSLIILLLAITASSAQIKNAKTESVKIYGNCNMCKTTIEKAGNLKRVVLVDWNEKTKMATLTYNSTKTNETEILKRIALAGYDSDLFLAPDDVYKKLPECCQYVRVNKSALVQNEIAEIPAVKNNLTAPEKEQVVNQLKAVFDNYFAVKDALVKSDQKLTAAAAQKLLLAINSVKMESLTAQEHTVWMKLWNSLKLNTEKIAALTNLQKQRNIFMDLSKNMYSLIKVSKQGTPVYYQHCPMYNNGKGADWLSKENAIKNPFYGSQMMTCGKTVETIK
jgi:hypothetical protein